MHYNQPLGDMLTHANLRSFHILVTKTVILDIQKYQELYLKAHLCLEKSITCM